MNEIENDPIHNRALNRGHDRALMIPTYLE